MEETVVDVYLETEYKKSKDLAASLKRALADELGDLDEDSFSEDPSKEAGMEQKGRICDEVGFEQVEELEHVLKFNLCDRVKESLKLKNVVVCGPEKSGKKTIVRRAVSRVWKELSKADSDGSTKLEDIFAFKTVAITKEPVRCSTYCFDGLEI